MEKVEEKESLLLSEYIKKFKTSKRQLALSVGVEPTTLTDILLHGRDIRMSTAIRIQEATYGMVTVEKLNEEATKIRTKNKKKI